MSAFNLGLIINFTRVQPLTRNTFTVVGSAIDADELVTLVY